MKSNVAKNTGPEMILRHALFASALRGYRLHCKKIPGRPDICFTKKKVAIFVNGCFWHRCPICDLSLPKTNTEFWERKFELNKERDKRKIKNLEDLGWNVLIVWECEIRNELAETVAKIQHTLENLR
jgi:DNA mismatch endonuclease (patch repair protein)